MRISRELAEPGPETVRIVKGRQARQVNKIMLIKSQVGGCSLFMAH